jgi:hypothetical protein
MESLNQFSENKKYIQNEIYNSVEKILTKESINKNVCDEIYKSIEKILNKENVVNETNLTVVTGIWDLKRDQAGEGFKRPFSHYIDNFKKLLKTDVNMLIHIEKKYEHIVWENRSPHNTKVVLKEVDYFRNNFDFYDQIQKIRNDESWVNSAEWLKNSTQATLELYNPMVMSKFFMLHDATCFNYFNTDYFLWIDGGLTNTVHEGYFTHDKVLNKITKYLKSLFFLSFPYVGNDEIHGFSREGMNKFCNKKYVDYVCRGGLFGGHKDFIKKHNSTYYEILRSSLSEEFMGTEESILTILSHKHPRDCSRYILDENGLVGKFFEALKNDEVEKDLIFEKEKKVSLYVLTYNSPDQFETLIESYLKHKNFVTKTDNYLIDNSKDLSTTEKYLELCKKYNFQHIKKDNIGICGGRQFAAEHFESSDSDFYIFLEDDMNLMPPNNSVCKSGFLRYTENLFEKCLEIMTKEKYDFLKLSFSEFYGTNNIQWAWYNVPQDIRDKFFEKKQLPHLGLDPDAPHLTFKNIKVYKNLAYADGDVYYCNWPHFISKDGNKKIFLDTKWARPFEQTWMSHAFQLTKENKINSAVLLLSPIDHERFDHYSAEERKES